MHNMCKQGWRDRKHFKDWTLTAWARARLAQICKGAMDRLLCLVSVLSQQDKADFISQLRTDQTFLYLTFDDVIYRRQKSKWFALKEYWYESKTLQCITKYFFELRFSMQDDIYGTKVLDGSKTSVAPRQRTSPQKKVPGYWPTICGSEYPSRSSSTVPVCRHVRSSNRLCRDSVETWGLLHLSPPSSTFSSNFTHLQIYTVTHTHTQSWSQAEKKGTVRFWCWCCSGPDAVYFKVKCEISVSLEQKWPNFSMKGYKSNLIWVWFWAMGWK